MKKKICLLGAFGVGKTSLVQRYVESIFSEEYLTTVGVKIDKKEVEWNGQTATLMLWDMAGEDAVSQVRLSHLRGASAYILVADGTRQQTLETAIDLHERATASIGAVPFELVVNKSDLPDQWEIPQSSLDALSEQGWPIILSSAKTGDGVDSVFNRLAARILS